MRWRRTLVFLHRDIGFLCLGLTVVYALSGLAVNHREHWDYNFSVSTKRWRVGTPGELLGLQAAGGGADSSLTMARRHQQQLASRLGQAVARSDAPDNVFWRGPEWLSLFFRGDEQLTVDYHPPTGTVVMQSKRPRFVLRLMNVLHLNERRGAWTYIADVYALLLLFLAVSGVLVVKGRRGLRGRGGIYLAVGVAAPVLALLLL